MDSTQIKVSPLWSKAEPDLPVLSSMAAEPALKKEHCLSWQRPYGAGAGLQNLGSTCYLNSALQCLTHTAPLATSLLSRQHSQSCCFQGFCMVCAMEAHVTRSLLHSGQVIRPSGALAATFHRHKQEDAHEFLMFTLNAMQKSYLRSHKNSQLMYEESTPIREMFGGYWRSQVRCLQCHATSDTCEAYLDISLDVMAAESVSQALAALVKPEDLQGENAYQCNSCQKMVPATKTLTLQTAPKVLIIVLKRFSAWTGDKMDVEVEYPEFLDLGPHLSDPSGGPLVYVLYAVLVHAGLSCRSGHYFSYVKAGNGQWYKMDDAKVTRSDISSVLSQRAYVLFYVQQSDVKGDRVAVTKGGVLGAQMTEDQSGSNSRTEDPGDSPVDARESQDHLQDTVTQEISLDQWKILQERNRPKPELNPRRVEVTLPPNVIIIHQSKFRDSLEKNHADKENFHMRSGSGLLSNEESMITGPFPGEARKPRANKKKNKKGKKPLVL